MPAGSKETQLAIPLEAIAARAYELYCDRGCADGHDLDDWFRAEAQLREETKAAVTRPASAATRKER